MRRLGLIVWVMALTLNHAFAQEAGQDPAVGGAELTNLFSPVYPALAREANITGDVEIEVNIRSDGSVASAVAITGNPMLIPAAVESAQRSGFQCRQCSEALTRYSLIYSFQIIPGPDWPCPAQKGVRVSHSFNHVTVTGEPSLVDPYFSDVRSRSAKCLYLWSCGSKWGGEDYYYYRVRSVKCLDLWNCGHRLREPFYTCNKLHREIE
jgi:hypothetical protein